MKSSNFPLGTTIMSHVPTSNVFVYTWAHKPGHKYNLSGRSLRPLEFFLGSIFKMEAFAI